jgi:predicted transcriptional regulator
MSNGKATKFSTRIHVRVTPEHHLKLSRIAEREGNDLAAVVRRVISEHEDRHEAEGPPRGESAIGEALRDHGDNCGTNPPCNGHSISTP